MEGSDDFADIAAAKSKARQDRAIERSSDDALDRGPFVDSIVSAIVHTDRDMRGIVAGRSSTGFVVGLTGEWGLGKSSVLNLVKEQLDGCEHVAVATINPWLFNSRDDLLAAYFSSLRDALGKTLKERARDVQVQLEKYKGAVGVGGTAAAAAVDAFGGGGVASTSWRLFGKRAVDNIKAPPSLSPDEERKSLEKKLKAAEIAVVVLIDELDRVEDDEVRAVAQLIKAVGDIKGISYLVAYDPRRVAQALGRGSDEVERQTSGEAYLEKIIQFAIPLRPLFEEDARALLEAALRESGASLPAAETEHQGDILNELISSVRTPREIKRLIGAFAVLEQIVRGEICPYDVLGYCWVATKTPAVRDAIASNPDSVVTDPGERELLRRLGTGRSDKSERDSVTGILGAAAKPQERMLKLLFPRFGKDDKTNIGNRISKRRNLVRLLYLGNPPGMMPRAEIERLWRLDSVDLSVQALRELQADGRIATLLERLPDLLVQLSEEHDTVFWRAISRTLVRQHDWITEQEALGSLVDDASETLWRFGRVSENTARRFRKIFDCMIDDGDLLVVPWILRKHLFAHHIAPNASSSGDEVLFSKDETIQYLDRELPRYRKAIIDGNWLRRQPDTDLLYAIYNAQRWTDELRASVTDQLIGIDAIGTFAALTVRPGYISDRATMNQLMDGETVLSRLVEIAKAGGLPVDPWLRASVTRLAATLRGHDPHFIRDYGDDNYVADGLPEPEAA